jgi:hypothetical protein
MKPGRRACLGTMAASLALAVSPVRSQGIPSEVAGELGSARLLGQGRLRFLGLSIYEARLWAADRVAPSAWAQTRLALELQYARSLVGKLIAERSLKEMQRQGEIATEKGQRWLAAMSAIFPDVGEGDRLTGVHRPGEAARFFFNGRPVGDIADADFARMFFGIWLAPQTSEPALRDALLGAGRTP